MRRFFPHAIFAALTAFAIAWGAALAAIVPLPGGPNDFNSPGFIVTHAWVKFALLATRPIRGAPSHAQEDALVARFFDLSARIQQDEQTGGQGCSTPDAAAAARTDELRLRDERSRIENQVELILEGRLTKVIKQAGLTRHVGADIVWPPVDIEFQDPPAVLVTSPRDQIRIESERLLQGDLPIARVQQIERAAEADGKTSALVVQISGIAMYPAIIPTDLDYESTLADIAHEWTHHYLAFTPLGRRYTSLRALNETVANIVGDDLGARMAQEYPLEPPPAADGSQPPPAVRAAAASGSQPTLAVRAAAASGSRPPPAVRASATSGSQPLPAVRAAASPPPPIDFNAEMHSLRLQVDQLLAAGKVADAEAAMDAKQQFFAEHGICIRKINQAFFAFNGNYADTPASSNPIGPTLADLRAREPSLKAFVETVREFTSDADLYRSLGLPPP